VAKDSRLTLPLGNPFPTRRHRPRLSTRLSARLLVLSSLPPRSSACFVYSFIDCQNLEEVVACCCGRANLLIVILSITLITPLLVKV